MSRKPFLVLATQVFVSVAVGVPALAQEALVSQPADPQEDAVSAPAPTAQSPQAFRGHRPHDPQHACAFALSEISRHEPGLEAIVSRDGSSITISARAKAPGTNPSNPPSPQERRAHDISVYTASGTSTVNGLACNFDRTKTVGDGAAAILLQAAQPHRHMGPPPQGMGSDEGPSPGPGAPGAGRGPGPGQNDRRQKVMARAVEECAKVYPQVEALVQSGALTSLIGSNSAPTPAAQGSSSTAAPIAQ